MENKRKTNGVAKVWQLQQETYRFEVYCNGLHLKEFFQVILELEMNEESTTHFQKLGKKEIKILANFFLTCIYGIYESLAF